VHDEAGQLDPPGRSSVPAANASDWELNTEPAPVAGSGALVVAFEYLSIDPQSAAGSARTPPTTPWCRSARGARVTLLMEGARVIGIAGGPEKTGGSSCSSTSDAITALAPEED